MTIPERFGIFTGDGFGRGSNWSRSSSHRCGAGGKQASPGSAKPLTGNISSGILYLSNSGKFNITKCYYKLNCTCSAVESWGLYLVGHKE